MAVWNEIGIGRWNRFIQKLCDMKGGPPARQLSSEIQFSHPIMSGVENRYLESWERFGLTTNQGAVAAQNSVIRLRNPANSNIIAVIERASVIEATADTVFLDIQNPDADLTGPTAGYNTEQTGIIAPLNGRGRPRSTLIMSQGNNINLGQTIAHTAFIVGNSGEFVLYDDQQLVIPPGCNVNFRSSAVNVALRASVLWRERFLEPAERF